MTNIIHTHTAGPSHLIFVIHGNKYTDATFNTGIHIRVISDPTLTHFNIKGQESVLDQCLQWY